MTPADLYYARGQLGVSIRRLAADLGVSPSTVSRWENGEQPIPRIAECAVNWLLVVQQSAEQFARVRATD